MLEQDDMRHDDELDAWLDGTLAPERIPAFVAWLRSDRVNRLALVRRARFNSDLRELVRVRAECGPEVLPRRRGRKVRKVRKVREQSSWWGLIAASAVAAVGAWLVLRQPARPDVPDAPSPVATQAPQPITPSPAPESFQPARVTLTPDAIAHRSDDGTVLRLEHGSADIEAGDAVLTVETPHARMVADGAAVRADVSHDAATIEVRHGSVTVQPGPPEASGQWTSHSVHFAAGAVVRIADGTLQALPPTRWTGIPGPTAGWEGVADADGITAVVEAQTTYPTEIRWVATPSNGPPLVRFADDQGIELEIVAEQEVSIAVTVVLRLPDGAWIGNLRASISPPAMVPTAVRLPLHTFDVVTGRRPAPGEGAVITVLSVVTGGGVGFTVRRLAVTAP